MKYHLGTLTVLLHLTIGTPVGAAPEPPKEAWDDPSFYPFAEFDHKKVRFQNSKRTLNDTKKSVIHAADESVFLPWFFDLTEDDFKVLKTLALEEKAIKDATNREALLPFNKKYKPSPISPDMGPPEDFEPKDWAYLNELIRTTSHLEQDPRYPLGNPPRP